MLPELPERALPVYRKPLPDPPLATAGWVSSEREPELAKLPLPVAIATKPPLYALLPVYPAIIVMLLPFEVVRDWPTRTEMSPDAPFAELPVPITTWPASP